MSYLGTKGKLARILQRFDRFVDVSKGTIRNLSERLIQGKNTEGNARRFASVPRLIKVEKEVFGDSRDSSYPIESKSVRIQGTTRCLVFENAFPLENLLADESNVSGIRCIEALSRKTLNHGIRIIRELGKNGRITRFEKNK